VLALAQALFVGQLTDDLEVSMRTMKTLLAASFVLVLGLSSSASAQERHAVPPADLARAVTQHVQSLDADRAAIREALSRPEVREVAERTGVDLDRLASAVDSLDPALVAQAAASARDVDAALVGGANTITISTTTIIIVLLLLILIIVAAR
jgi:hypothetical protein